MSLPRLFAVVVAFDVLGLAVAVATGADDLVSGVVAGTPINAPFGFVAVQAIAVHVATRHRAGAAALAVLCLLSIASGVGDGAYATDLAAGERAVQLAIVATTALLGAAAARTALNSRARATAVG